MNIALAYNDINRYWSPGSFLKRELAKYNEIDIVAHCRIPEDTGILEEQCKLNIDLIIVIDDGNPQYMKLHHHRGKLGKAKSCIWLSDLHRPDWASWRLQQIREWHYDHVFYAQKDFKKIVMNQGYKENECSWLCHAADPEIFKPMPPIAQKYDAGYIGYTNEKRDRFFNVVKQFVNFKHFSSVWENVANRCMNELKICIDIPVENDTCNMRAFESTIAGVPLLIQMTDKNGFDEIFNNDMYLAFENENDLKEKLVRLIANPDMRKDMSSKAYNHSIKFHTYKNRINQIFKTMNFLELVNYVR